MYPGGLLVGNWSIVPLPQVPTALPGFLGITSQTITCIQLCASGCASGAPRLRQQLVKGWKKTPNYNMKSEHLGETVPCEEGMDGPVCVCVCLCSGLCVSARCGHTVTKFCFQPDISKIPFQHGKNVKIVNENTSLKYQTLAY